MPLLPGGSARIRAEPNRPFHLRIEVGYGNSRLDRIRGRARVWPRDRRGSLDDPRRLPRAWNPGMPDPSTPTELSN